MWLGLRSPISDRPTPFFPSQFSGAYGVSNSWVIQRPPLLPGLWYGLNGVTVLRGSTAITVGGSPFAIAKDAYDGLLAIASPYTDVGRVPLRSSGVLLMTLNGGFSWLQQARVCRPARPPHHCRGASARRRLRRR